MAINGDYSADKTMFRGTNGKYYKVIGKNDNGQNKLAEMNNQTDAKSIFDNGGLQQYREGTPMPKKQVKTTKSAPRNIEYSASGHYYKREGKYYEIIRYDKNGEPIGRLISDQKKAAKSFKNDNIGTNNGLKSEHKFKFNTKVQQYGDHLYSYALGADGKIYKLGYTKVGFLESLVRTAGEKLVSTKEITPEGARDDYAEAIALLKQEHPELKFEKDETGKIQTKAGEKYNAEYTNPVTNSKAKSRINGIKGYGFMIKYGEDSRGVTQCRFFDNDNNEISREQWMKENNSIMNENGDIVEYNAKEKLKARWQGVRDFVPAMIGFVQKPVTDDEGNIIYDKNGKPKTKLQFDGETLIRNGLMMGAAIGATLLFPPFGGLVVAGIFTGMGAAEIAKAETKNASDISPEDKLENGYVAGMSGAGTALALAGVRGGIRAAKPTIAKVRAKNAATRAATGEKLKVSDGIKNSREAVKESRKEGRARIANGAKDAVTKPFKKGGKGKAEAEPTAKGTRGAEENARPATEQPAAEGTRGTGENARPAAEQPAETPSAPKSKTNFWQERAESKFRRDISDADHWLTRGDLRFWEKFGGELKSLERIERQVNNSKKINKAQKDQLLKDIDARINAVKNEAHLKENFSDIVSKGIKDGKTKEQAISEMIDDPNLNNELCLDKMIKEIVADKDLSVEQRQALAQKAYRKMQDLNPSKYPDPVVKLDRKENRQVRKQIKDIDDANDLKALKDIDYRGLNKKTQKKYNNKLTKMIKDTKTLKDVEEFKDFAKKSDKLKEAYNEQFNKLLKEAIDNTDPSDLAKLSTKYRSEIEGNKGLREAYEARKGKIGADETPHETPRAKQPAEKTGAEPKAEPDAEKSSQPENGKKTYEPPLAEVKKAKIESGFTGDEAKSPSPDHLAYVKRMLDETETKDKANATPGLLKRIGNEISELRQRWEKLGEEELEISFRNPLKRVRDFFKGNEETGKLSLLDRVLKRDNAKLEELENLLKDNNYIDIEDGNTGNLIRTVKKLRNGYSVTEYNNNSLVTEICYNKKGYVTQKTFTKFGLDVGNCHIDWCTYNKNGKIISADFGKYAVIYKNGKITRVYDSGETLSRAQIKEFKKKYPQLEETGAMRLTPEEMSLREGESPSQPAAEPEPVVEPISEYEGISPSDVVSNEPAAKSIESMTTEEISARIDEIDNRLMGNSLDTKAEIDAFITERVKLQEELARRKQPTEQLVASETPGVETFEEHVIEPTPEPARPVVTDEVAKIPDVQPEATTMEGSSAVDIEIARVQEQLARLNNEIRETHELIGRTRGEIEIKTRELGGIETDLNDASIKLNDARTDLNNAKELLGKLEEDMRTNEKLLRKGSNHIKPRDIKRKIEQQNALIESLEAKVNVLEKATQLKRLNKTIETAESRLNEMETRRAELETKRANLDEQRVQENQSLDNAANGEYLPIAKNIPLDNLTKLLDKDGYTVIGYSLRFKNLELNLNPGRELISIRDVSTGKEYNATNLPIEIREQLFEQGVKTDVIELTQLSDTGAIEKIGKAKTKAELEEIENRLTEEQKLNESIKKALEERKKAIEEEEEAKKVVEEERPVTKDKGEDVNKDPVTEGKGEGKGVEGKGRGVKPAIGLGSAVAAGAAGNAVNAANRLFKEQNDNDVLPIDGYDDEYDDEIIEDIDGDGDDVDSEDPALTPENPEETQENPEETQETNNTENSAISPENQEDLGIIPLDSPDGTNYMDSQYQNTLSAVQRAGITKKCQQANTMRDVNAMFLELRRIGPFTGRRQLIRMLHNKKRLLQSTEGTNKYDRYETRDIRYIEKTNATEERTDQRYDDKNKLYPNKQIGFFQNIWYHLRDEDG